MISYGDAIRWCIQNQAVMRFVNSRSSLVQSNSDSEVALELAIDLDGKTIVARCSLSHSSDPSKAAAVAVIGCVQYFVERKASALVSVN